MLRALTLAAVLALAVGETDAIAQTVPAAPASSPYADPSCPTLAEVEAILTAKHETCVVLDVTDLLSVATDGVAKVLPKQAI